MVVALSYQQMVRAYSTSGGSFIVAKENLGDFAGVLTGSALMIDYTLTVAVSVSAGVLAITSAAQGLSGASVEIAVLFVVVIALANLRGARESGRVFAVPAYGFILLMGVTIFAGIGTCAVSGCPEATTPDPIPPGADALTVFLVLKAFSSGASALTGIEAIANGVSAFKQPQAQNAARTLGILAAIAVFLFIGVSWLAVHLHAAPSESASVLSQIGRRVFPEGSWSGFLYYLFQGVTFAILVLAANTSFQGFPRLLATLAGEALRGAPVPPPRQPARLLERDPRARPALDRPADRVQSEHAGARSTCTCSGSSPPSPSPSSEWSATGAATATRGWRRSATSTRSVRRSPAWSR